MIPVDAKRCSIDEAIEQIPDGCTIVSGGFCGAAHPEALTAAIERHYLDHKRPKDLTLIYGAGQGDARDRGLNHLGHEGLVSKVIGGHWRLAPKLGKLALDGKIEAYNIPQGVVCQLLRDIAAGRPGCITHVGLDTFIDPINDGGAINSNTPNTFVERIELGDKTWLWYKAMPVDVGLIRATAADPFGNLIMDEEAIAGEVLPIAQAVHNSARGKPLVIAQVKRILDSPAAPHRVRVPGILVDRVVIADDQDQHQQVFGEYFNPAYVAPQSSDQALPELEKLPMDARRIIAARACDELQPGMIVNLGIGMPEGIARIAAERDLLHHFTLTVESGPIGGMPAGGLSFGASMHPMAIVDQPAQFDFYDGRGLDYAALGAAQIDAAGNVNVSRFGNVLAGVGGFVNITQNAKQLVFCGTFTAGGLDVQVVDGRLKIIAEGKVRKFIKNVEQISFAASHSREVGQDVLYVTERAVFRLADNGLMLSEVAPGIDVERDILSQMAFKPVIGELSPMNSAAFAS